MNKFDTYKNEEEMRKDHEKENHRLSVKWFKHLREVRENAIRERNNQKPTNEFKTCIYCCSFDIHYNEDNDNLWFCNNCGEKWED